MSSITFRTALSALAVLALTLPASAGEKWLKIDPNDPFSKEGVFHQFDVDSVFEDRATGYVVSRMIYVKPEAGRGRSCRGVARVGVRLQSENRLLRVRPRRHRHQGFRRLAHETEFVEGAGDGRGDEHVREKSLRAQGFVAEGRASLKRSFRTQKGGGFRLRLFAVYPLQWEITS